MSSKLKEARLNTGYSIEDISLKLNIRKQYLIDLEEENYEAIPGQIYVEGYVKLYAEFLDIERPIINNNNEADSIRTKYRLKKSVRKSFSQKYFILASIFLLTIIFTIYNYIKSGDKNVTSDYSTAVDFSTNAVNNTEISAVINDSTTKNLNKIFNNENNNTGLVTNN